MTSDAIAELAGPEVAPKDGADPDSLVIFAHGYGSNGQDLIGLVPHLQPHLPKTQFLSPNACEPCPMAPGGYQWFPISSLDRTERDTGTYKAAPALDHYVSRQLDRFSVPANRCVLIGFSQGTMLSLHVGLRRQEPVAGILGFSGTLAAPGKLIDEMRSKPPVLLVHGAADEVIPVWLMFEAVGALQAANVPVDKHVSQNVPHSIGPDGLQKGAAFLKRVLGA